MTECLRGCGNDAVARGLCNTHYATYRRRLVAYGRWDNGMVPMVGTTRRLRALSALGWPYRALGAELGLGNARSTLPRLMSARGDIVAAVTAERVADMYERLSATPGPSVITRQRALAKGWVPPLAWDDDTIDDPDAVPHVEAVREPNRRGDFAAEYAELRDYVGLTDPAIAKRLGISSEALEKRLMRLGIPTQAASQRVAS